MADLAKDIAVPLTIGDAVDALAAADYLRAEADLNRSWADGRRGLFAPTETYKARRLEIAKERERWASAIERFVMTIIEPDVPQTRTGADTP